MAVTVLRLGHRIERDKRVTTHVALVARAFGAAKIVYSGERDSVFENSVKKVVREWGGPFSVSYAKNWKSFIRDFRGERVHLTMYGIPSMPALRSKSVLVIVGGEKVPPEVFKMAGFNVAIGSQPHSEVAALAVFLDRLSGPKEKFSRAKIRVVPAERGKKVARA
jgi:tRNA (cytidine56-2'-O)-methyltransferase